MSTQQNIKFCTFQQLDLEIFIRTTQLQKQDRRHNSWCIKCSAYILSNKKLVSQSMSCSRRWLHSYWQYLQATAKLIEKHWAAFPFIDREPLGIPLFIDWWWHEYIYVLQLVISGSRNCPSSVQSVPSIFSSLLCMRKPILTFVCPLLSKKIFIFLF